MLKRIGESRLTKMLCTIVPDFCVIGAGAFSSIGWSALHNCPANCGVHICPRKVALIQQAITSLVSDRVCCEAVKLSVAGMSDKVSYGVGELVTQNPNPSRQIVVRVPRDGIIGTACPRDRHGLLTFCRPPRLHAVSNSQCRQPPFFGM